MLFYETYGKGSPEQELSPRYALLAEDSVVQAVPEHPKKENVFCLSNSYGDVYLFQVGPWISTVWWGEKNAFWANVSCFFVFFAVIPQVATGAAWSKNAGRIDFFFSLVMTSLAGTSGRIVL